MAYFFTLAHFCDTHGPVLLITSRKRNQPEGPLPTNHAATCELCELRLPSDIGPDVKCIVTKGQDVAYLSLAQFNSKEVDNKLRLVVLRALSEEASLRLCIFGDTTLMYSISRCFTLEDPSARGKVRKYALIMTSDHQAALVANVAKIRDFFHYLIRSIRSKHTGYLAQINTMALRTRHRESPESLDSDSDPEKYYSEQIRTERVELKNLVDLLNDKEIYLRIHAAAVKFLTMLYGH